MKKGQINLDKLKTEIESRKNNKNDISTKLGESVVNDSDYKGSFLSELLYSLNNSQETNSSKAIKLIENKVAVNSGEKPKLHINQPTQQVNTQQSDLSKIDMSEERDNLMYEQFNQKINNKQTLTQSLENYSHLQQVNPNVQVPGNNNVPLLNENYVNNIKNIVNEQLMRNSLDIVNEAFKTMIVELYTRDKVIEVLKEEKKMIKDLIYEVIKEIKNKPKS